MTAPVRPQKPKMPISLYKEALANGWTDEDILADGEYDLPFGSTKSVSQRVSPAPGGGSRTGEVVKALGKAALLTARNVPVAGPLALRATGLNDEADAAQEEATRGWSRVLGKEGAEAAMFGANIAQGVVGGNMAMGGLNQLNAANRGVQAAKVAVSGSQNTRRGAREAAKRLAVNAASGAATGAVSSPEGMEGPGAVLGGALGAIVPGAVSGVSQLARRGLNAYRRYTDPLVGAADELSKSTQTGRINIPRALADAPEGAIAADVLGADAQDVLRAANAEPSEARTALQQNLAGRAAGRAERIRGELGHAAGIGETNPYTELRNIERGTRPAISHGYQIAYQDGALLDDPHLMAQLLGEDQTPLMQDAVRRALRTMENRRTGLPQTPPTPIVPGGAARVTDMPLAQRVRQEATERLERANAVLNGRDVVQQVPIENLRPLGGLAVERETARRAQAETARRARAEGQRNSALRDMAEVSTGGPPSPVEGQDASTFMLRPGETRPSLEFADRVKRNLDKRARQAVRQGDLTAAAEVQEERARLVSRLDELVPGYREARANDHARRLYSEAIELGRRLATGETDPRATNDLLERMIPESVDPQVAQTTREYYRRGLMDGLRRQMDRGASGNAEITKLAGSPYRREIAEMVIPSERARGEFGDAMQRERILEQGERAGLSRGGGGGQETPDPTGAATPWAIGQLFGGSPGLFTAQVGGQALKNIESAGLRRSAEQIVRDMGIVVKRNGRVTPEAEALVQRIMQQRSVAGEGIERALQRGRTANVATRAVAPNTLRESR